MNRLDGKWVVKTDQDWFVNERLGITRVLRDQTPISIYSATEAQSVQLRGYEYAHLTKTVIIPVSEVINEENEIMPARFIGTLDTTILNVWVRVSFVAHLDTREVEYTSYEVVDETYDDDGVLWTSEMMSEFVTTHSVVSNDLNQECLDYATQ
jgi:hypothetical protein